MKNTYYKIEDVQDNEIWYCSEFELKNGIFEWIRDSEGEVKVNKVEMTREEFDKQFSQERFNEIGFVYDDFETVKAFIKKHFISKQKLREIIVNNRVPINPFSEAHLADKALYDILTLLNKGGGE